MFHVAPEDVERILEDALGHLKVRNRRRDLLVHW